MRLTMICVMLVIGGVVGRCPVYRAYNNVSLVLTGHTGSGKSTFADLLAGGHRLAKVGTVNGASQTEQSCSHYFKYNGSVDAKPWLILDTPGFADTGGGKYEVRNEVEIQDVLHVVGAVDGILLAWKYDAKFTEEFMASFLFLRANFGPNVWVRTIVVYTFWPWGYQDFPPCKTRSDLLQVHIQTMDAAFNYISDTLKTGDQRCNSTHNVDCFPQATDIPFVASGLSMDRLEMGRNHGFNLLDPANSLEKSKCPHDPNTAEEISRLGSFVRNMKASLEPMNTTLITNSWIACRYALEGIQGFITTVDNKDTDVDSIASNFTLCAKSAIASETNDLAQQLHGRHDVQMKLAFRIPPAYVEPKYGFSASVARARRRYADYDTYVSCRFATDMNNHGVAVVLPEMLRCWTGLQGSHSRTPEDGVAIREFRASFLHRGKDFRMAAMFRFVAPPACSVACPGKDFVEKLATPQEKKTLASWQKSLAGRCCVHTEAGWNPIRGACHSAITWNESSLSCLQACDLSELEMPPCSLDHVPGSELRCKLSDVFGDQHVVKVKITAGNTSRVNYLPTGERISLNFEILDEPHFVLENTEQSAQCHDGQWSIQEGAGWKQPRARQIRSCNTVCEDSECRSSRCKPGRHSKGHLWLEDDSVDSSLCYDARVCGEQNDIDCSAPPACGDGYKPVPCSQSSCSSGDCCKYDGVACADVTCGCPFIHSAVLECSAPPCAGKCCGRRSIAKAVLKKGCDGLWSSHCSDSYGSNYYCVKGWVASNFCRRDAFCNCNYDQSGDNDCNKICDDDSMTCGASDNIYEDQNDYDFLDLAGETTANKYLPTWSTLQPVIILVTFAVLAVGLATRLQQNRRGTLDETLLSKPQ